MLTGTSHILTAVFACVSNSARPGHAKPNDHCCEIFVGIVKRLLEEGHLSIATIERYSKNGVFLLRLLEAMRRVMHLGKRVSRHSRKWSSEQVNQVRNHLRERKVFVYTPGRSLPVSMKSNIMEQADEAAVKFLGSFLADKLEPLLETEIEKLPAGSEVEGSSATRLDVGEDD